MVGQISQRKGGGKGGHNKGPDALAQRLEAHARHIAGDKEHLPHRRCDHTDGDHQREDDTKVDHVHADHLDQREHHGNKDQGGGSHVQHAAHQDQQQQDQENDEVLVAGNGQDGGDDEIAIPSFAMSRPAGCQTR